MIKNTIYAGKHISSNQKHTMMHGSGIRRIIDLKYDARAGFVEIMLLIDSVKAF